MPRTSKCMRLMPGSSVSKLITWQLPKRVKTTARNSPPLSARQVRNALLNPPIVASKRINVVLSEFTSAVFTAQVQVGAGANLTGSEPLEMRLMLDTRNHLTVLLNESCATCNNTNKYIAHENATKSDDLKIEKVLFSHSYFSEDQACLRPRRLYH